jgi:cystathionine beta-synthase
MVTHLEVVPPSASYESLLPLFKADKIAIVAEGTTFYGLITRVDLINHIRKTIN